MTRVSLLASLLPNPPTPAAWLLTQMPIAVEVTKIDICPPTVLKQTRQALAKYLRQNQKMPYPIKDISQVSTFFSVFCVVAVFLVLQLFPQ